MFRFFVTWKTSFLAHFGHYWPKKTQKFCFSSKTQFRHFLHIRWQPDFMQKSGSFNAQKKLTEKTWEKNSIQMDKATNGIS